MEKSEGLTDKRKEESGMLRARWSQGSNTSSFLLSDTSFPDDQRGAKREYIRPRKKLQMEKHRTESSEDSTTISTVGRKKS